MSLKAVALLDPPSPASLGVVPFVIEAEGALRVCGVKGRPRERLDRKELSELIAEGHALEIPPAELSPEVDQDWMAGWLGDEFREKARALRAPSICVPLGGGVLPGKGSFWFGPLAQVYGLLDRWLREAARDCFEEGKEKADLASLMQWVLPSRLETQAAVWYTRAEQDRNRELAWFMRLRRDQGHQVTEPELIDSFTKVVTDYRETVSRNLSKYPEPYTRLPKEDPFLSKAA